MGGAELVGDTLKGIILGQAHEFDTGLTDQQAPHLLKCFRFFPCCPSLAHETFDGKKNQRTGIYCWHKDEDEAKNWWVFSKQYKRTCPQLSFQGHYYKVFSEPLLASVGPACVAAALSRKVGSC